MSFRALAVAAVVTLSLAARGAALAEPPVKVPPGTRADPTGALVSSRGLRETGDFIGKELEHRGIAVTQVGPYKVRGAEVTRFVSQLPSTPWLAIHVLRSGGKTLIFFVPRTNS